MVHLVLFTKVKSIISVKRTTDGEVYALKRIKIKLLNQKEKESSLNEIRFLASIKSKYIIEYKESFYDETNECLCIIMEYAIFGDLDKLI